MSTSQTANKKNSTLKTLLIVLGAGAAILGVVLFLGSRSGSNDKAPSTGLVTESGGTQVSAGSLGDTNSTARRSDQIVALLNSVSSIKLDDSIFRNPAFSALRDINSTLPADRNPGRDNPFLPIGQEGSVTTSSIFQQVGTSATSADGQSTTPDSIISTGDAALQDFVGTETTTQ
jgi:hypothetical protein